MKKRNIWINEKTGKRVIIRSFGIAYNVQCPDGKIGCYVQGSGYFSDMEVFANFLLKKFGTDCSY